MLTIQDTGCTLAVCKRNPKSKESNFKQYQNTNVQSTINVHGQ